MPNASTVDIKRETIDTLQESTTNSLKESPHQDESGANGAPVQLTSVDYKVESFSNRILIGNLPLVNAKGQIQRGN